MRAGEPVVAEFKQRGGTIVFVSHDAAAVERLCERAVLLRAGTVDFDGSTREAMVRYQRLLAEERDLEEREAGLTELGEARIAEATLVGPQGEERKQLLSGEAFTLCLRIAAERPLPPPRLTYELRDQAGWLLAAGVAEIDDLGWDGVPGDRLLTFAGDRLPLADGRFRLRLSLTDGSGERVYHRLDDALRFLVYPGTEVRGPVLLEGSWRMEHAGAELGAR